MKRGNLTAVLAGLAVILTFADAASAMHHPTLGRFLQRDPAGYVDGENLYEYVRSAPTYWRDPFGKQRVGYSEQRKWIDKELDALTAQQTRLEAQIAEAESRGDTYGYPEMLGELENVNSRIENRRREREKVSGQAEVNDAYRDGPEKAADSKPVDPIRAAIEKVWSAAEKRRGRGPWKDSAQHCWMACFISATMGVGWGELAAAIESKVELDDRVGDYKRDIEANHIGALCPLASPPLFLIFPNSLCDCCCGSWPGQAVTKE